MSELWKPNDGRYIAGYVNGMYPVYDYYYHPHQPENFINNPNMRLYQNLTHEQLHELIQDAKCLHWKVLDLSCCGLNALPDELWELTDLQYLNFSGTPGKTSGDSNTFFALPSEIKQLSNLQELDLSHSQIWELPDSIGQLSNLRELNLSYCHLKEIPYGVVKLGLPFELHYPFGHNCVNLTGVTLDEGDLSLFAQPRQVIEEYYRDRMPEALNECKVIFLGDGAVGKSSLIQRIVNGTFEKDTSPTDGVKMTKWRRRSDGTSLQLGGKPLIIRFLDFGGQEIMHSMHRCFLTEHTVYVVVCESRDDAGIDRIAARWMYNVKAFAPDCPVILVLNKSDLNPNAKVNEWALKDINPKYRHMLHTSAKTNDGVETLENSILREVPACLQQMNGNAGFLGLKRELENMEEDYLLPKRFSELCGQYMIKENLRLSLLKWFKALGVAYAYSTSFQNIYVLNPVWLTNGIYRLIVRAPNGGFLSHSVIRDTLRTPNPNDIDPSKIYTGQEMDFILHVMRQFEISLEAEPPRPGRDAVEMIPMKMDKTPPPKYGEFSKTDTLHLRWEAGYLPNNLIHRLMIRKYPELDAECCWLTGGWFRSADKNCEALAEMSENALDVYVKGDYDARVYMETFRAQILEILKSLNIRAEEIICCVTDGQEGRISYTEVLKLYFDNMPYVSIPGIRKYVSPAELLRLNYEKIEYHGREYQTVNITGGTFMNIRDVSNSIFSESGAVSGTINISGGAEQKADFDVVAQAIQNMKIPDPKKLALLKRQLEALSKEGGLPLTVQSTVKLLLLNLKTLDENSQESGNKVWEALKPFIGDGENLAATLSMFGEYGSKLLGILKVVFLHA